MKKFISIMAMLFLCAIADGQVATSIPYGFIMPGVLDQSFNTYLSDPGPLNFPTYAVMYKEPGGWRLKVFPKLVAPLMTNAEYVTTANWNYAAGASVTVNKVSGGSEWPQTLLVFRRDK